MTVGIIGAMTEEVLAISKYMTVMNRIKKGDFLFQAGFIEEVDAVIVQSGIGKVSGSIACAVLIEKFNPDLIINIGSAGGIGKEKEIGDIIISNRVRYHDVDVTAFGYHKGQLPQHPEYYNADNKLIKIAINAAKASGLNRHYVGEILSGDTFVSDDDLVAELEGHFPETIAVEMEAGGIAQCCFHLQKPYIVIRALSDVAGKKSTIDFDDFLNTASTNSAKLVLQIIKEIKKNNNDIIGEILDGKNS